MPRGQQVLEQIDGVGLDADRHRLAPVAGLERAGDGGVETSAPPRPGSGWRAGARCASRSTSATRQVPLVHGDGERLRAAHAAEAGGDHEAAGERAAEVLAGALGEGLVGALEDALGADVDPRAGGHLAVHGQPQPLQAAELVRGGPVRHEQRVGDQHARRVGVGAEHRHRLARLHEQRLVVAPAAAASPRSPRSTPSCAPPCPSRRRPPGPPVARPPRGRGCSSACAAPPPAASRGRRARCRAGRGRCGEGRQGSRSRWSSGCLF